MSDPYNLIPDDNANAKPFRDMANKIMHNADNGFGGALVIVPPEGGGEAVSVILLDDSKDAAQFWGLIPLKAQIALTKLAQNERTNQAFPPRR